MRLPPAEMSPIGAGIERRPAIMADAGLNKKRACVVGCHYQALSATLTRPARSRPGGRSALGATFWPASSRPTDRWVSRRARDAGRAAGRWPGTPDRRAVFAAQA